MLFTNIAKALDKAGTDGTLPMALRAIAEQSRPVIVVPGWPRVPAQIQRAIAADQTSKVIGTNTGGQRTGIQALLTAQQKLGVKPRILGAPGLDTKPVADALTSAAEQLRAMAYVSAHGAEDVSQALAYAEGFGKRETMVIWPDFKAWDTEANAAVPVPAVAYAMGLRAKIDREQGWHKSLSNVPLHVKHHVVIGDLVADDVLNAHDCRLKKLSLIVG